MSRLLSSAERCEIGGICWRLAPGTSSAAARPAIERVLQEIADGAANLRDGRRKELYRIGTGAREPTWLVKVQRYDHGAGWLQRRRGSKAFRELAIAVALRERGIDVPLPLAAGETRTGARLDRCYLILRMLHDVSDLRTLWHQHGVSRSRRSAWIAGLGRSARRLHDAGLLQEDFAPNNFLLREADPIEVLPIDFERARIVHRVGMTRRRRMITRLQQHLADASAADKLRFLQSYSEGDRAAARHWWRSVAAASPRVARLDLARLQRNAARDGRRIRRVEWGDWQGVALRDVPLVALARERTAGPLAVEPAPTQSFQVEPDGELWCGSGAGSPAEARKLWAHALLLFSWGMLGPRPLACLARDDDRLRIWFARDPTARTLLQLRHLAGAHDAAAVLVDRLQGLGRLDPWVSPRKIAVIRRPDGGLRAQLLAPTALRVGRAARQADPRSARKFLEQRLQEVDQHVESIRENSS